MHQIREEVSKIIPIPRKGNKYVVRTRSHLNESVSVLTAVRDILKLAKTSKEVKAMIKNKALKLNGRVVNDFRESIKLFNILEADKPYKLNLLPTKRFILEESKEKDLRICKVIGKKIVSGNKVQLNLHDGSNLVSKENISVGDTVYLDFSGKVKKHVPFEKGHSVLVFKGKYLGSKGKIESADKNKAKIKLEDNKLTELNQSQVIII